MVDQVNIKLQQTLSQVAKSCGLNEWQYERTPLNGIMENYCSDLVLVSITGNKENESKIRHFLIKTAPIKHELREIDLLNAIFKIEAHVYSVLLPDYKIMNTNINIDKILPKCYFTDVTPFEEAIVLNNKTHEGYHMFSERFLNADHVKVAMKTLAQFHALSLILQKKDEKANLIHKEILKPACKIMHPGHLVHIKDVMNKTGQMFAGTKYEQIITNLHCEFDEALINETKYSNITVFGHGDVWKENILFKYENNKPVCACLIDFQAARLLNPAFDVLSFLLNSVSAETRRICYHDFLSTYYNTLQISLSDNGVDMQKIYSKTQFNKDLKSITPVCFAFVQLAFCMWLGLEEGSMLSSKNPCQTEKQKLASKNELKTIIRNIVEDLQSFGYLDI